MGCITFTKQDLDHYSVDLEADILEDNLKEKLEEEQCEKMKDFTFILGNITFNTPKAWYFRLNDPSQCTTLPQHIKESLY